MKKAVMQKMFDAVTVGERGQIVIPAQVRKLFRIKAGDKLVVFAKRDGPIGLMPAQYVHSFLEKSVDTLGGTKA